MNVHAERSNRTIQESFVGYHEDLLFTDLARFNQKLAELLIYNAERPHHRLAQKTRHLSSYNTNPSAKGGGRIPR